MEENEKLIEAAKILHSICDNDDCNHMKVDCPFQIKSIYNFWTCRIEGRPSCWDLDEVQDDE